MNFQRIAMFVNMTLRLMESLTRLEIIATLPGDIVGQLTISVTLQLGIQSLFQLCFITWRDTTAIFLLKTWVCQRVRLDVSLKRTRSTYRSPSLLWLESMLTMMER